MRRTFSSFFFLALSLCSTLRGQSAVQTTKQEPTQSASKNPLMRFANNGAWWGTLSQDSKSDFVDGFVTAMASIHKLLMSLVQHNSKELTPGPKFDVQMDSIIQLSVIAERYEYEEVGREKLLGGVDTFYKEPLNKLIPIELAFAWERDTLNGKVAPRDLQKQLDEWRTTMNK
jgi:hypothetical protein